MFVLPKVSAVFALGLLAVGSSDAVVGVGIPNDGVALLLTPPNLKLNPAVVTNEGCFAASTLTVGIDASGFFSLTGSTADFSEGLGDSANSDFVFEESEETSVVFLASVAAGIEGNGLKPPVDPAGVVEGVLLNPPKENGCIPEAFDGGAGGFGIDSSAFTGLIVGAVGEDILKSFITGFTDASCFFVVPVDTATRICSTLLEEISELL